MLLLLLLLLFLSMCVIFFSLHRFCTMVCYWFTWSVRCISVADILFIIIEIVCTLNSSQQFFFGNIHFQHLLGDSLCHENVCNTKQFRRTYISVRNFNQLWIYVCTQIWLTLVIESSMCVYVCFEKDGARIDGILVTISNQNKGMCISNMFSTFTSVYVQQHAAYEQLAMLVGTIMFVSIRMRENYTLFFA